MKSAIRLRCILPRLLFTRENQQKAQRKQMNVMVFFHPVQITDKINNIKARKAKKATKNLVLNSRW